MSNPDMQHSTRIGKHKSDISSSLEVLLPNRSGWKTVVAFSDKKSISRRTAVNVTTTSLIPDTVLLGALWEWGKYLDIVLRNPTTENFVNLAIACRTKQFRIQFLIKLNSSH
jgi:hypothetical protein